MSSNSPFIEKIGEANYLLLIEKLKRDLPEVYQQKRIDEYVSGIAVEVGIGKTTLYTKIIKPLVKEFDLKPKAKVRAKSTRGKVILTSTDKEKITALYNASFFPTKKAFYAALELSGLLGNNFPCRTTVDRCLEQLNLDTSRHNTSLKTENKNKVCGFYNQGKSVEEICEECSLSDQVVKSYLREFGVSFSKTASPDYQLEVLDYYYEHGTPATIEKYGVPQNTQARWRKNWGLPARYNDNKSRLYDLDQDFFKVIDTEEKAYLVGLLAADGNVYKNVIGLELKREDKDHLRKVSEIIGSTKPIMDTIHYVKESNSYKEGAKVAFISKYLVEQLCALGITENKSHTLSINFNLIPSLLHKHFWRGVLDGDGSLFMNGDYPVIDIYGTKSICNLFKEYVSNTLNISLGGPWRNGSVWRTGIQAKDTSPIVANHFYRDSTIFLDRKKKIADDWYKQKEQSDN